MELVEKPRGDRDILDSYTVEVWYALRLPTVQHPQKVRGCLTSHRPPNLYGLCRLGHIGYLFHGVSETMGSCV